MHFMAMALVLVTGMIAPAAAAIIRVPSGYSTIQAGINAATPGDTVLVALGTYTGAANRNLDFAGKNLVLLSSGGATVTVIDCQGQGRGLHFHTGEAASAVVRGFTIRNGLASGTFGGAILIEGGSSPTIRDCRLQSNHANTGGGIFVASGVTLINSEFESNTADNWGGAIYGESASVDATGCSFAQNGAGIGAGIYVQLGTTLTLSDCSFTENAPANLAGGIYGSGSALVLQRCSFVGNAGKEGAGMYLLEGTASVDSCTFMMNTADYSGGGLRAEQVEAFRVTGCMFGDNATLLAPVGNSRTGGGGLSYLRTEPLIVGPYVADCTFIANRALDPAGIGGIGGGMTIAAGEQSLTERCTFIGNHAGKTGGGASCGGAGRLQDCLFEGNSSGLNAGGLNGAEEIIDCRFVDNHAQRDGGGCYGVNRVVRCEFSGNSAGGRGGGCYWVYFNPFSIENSRFSDNYANQGGGLFMYDAHPALVTGCTFERNTAAADGGGASVTGPAAPPPVTFSGCTLVGNRAPTGGALSLTIPVAVENTIIAFGTEGEAIRCGTGPAVLSCTDIFGNAGGDWVGCIAEQLGINGCFSADPLFCNAAAGDYTLAEASPCTPAHSPAGCGLIGAHPVACVTPIGVEEAAPPVAALSLTVDPNPITSDAVVEMAGGRGVLRLSLHDVAGRLVARRDVRAESGAESRLRWRDLVGMRGLPAGVYFLQVASREEGRAPLATTRVVVTK